jgi:antitoxin Phd
MTAEPLPEPAGHDLGITDARDRLAEVVNEAAYTGTVTYISRRGRRLAAIVPAEDAERLEDAEDTYLLSLATESLDELAHGAQPIPWEQAKAELRNDA